MPPPSGWIQVDDEFLGRLQAMLDSLAVDMLKEPLEFGVKAGLSIEAKALEQRVTDLKTALAAEKESLGKLAQELRAAVGTYSQKLREANDDTARAGVGFEVGPTTKPVPQVTGP